jgi:hypothetical protein
MKIRNLLITVVCALFLCGGLWAQGSPSLPEMAGTYGLALNGFATVAPGPVVLPFVALGVVTFDRNGLGSGQYTEVFAGQTFPQATLTINLTAAKDGTLTWTASCSMSCVWSGTGTYSKKNREISLLFTQANDVPVTAIAILKEL